MPTDSAVSPEIPVPVETPLSMQELSTVLIKHYGLHEGRYDLLVEFLIGSGPIGPDPAGLVPGVMLGVRHVGLMVANVNKPTTVDAAVVNPAPANVTRKKASVKTSKAAAKEPKPARQQRAT